MSTGIASLVDMGVPRSRAEAALMKSRGDAVLAAERIFNGEFDHVNSNDAGVDVLGNPNSDIHLHVPDNSSCASTCANPLGGQSTNFAIRDDAGNPLVMITEALDYDKADGTYLSRGEWMSGVSEGDEQSYLFQLYEELSDGTLACPCCGRLRKRTMADFFEGLTLKAYIDHLVSSVQYSCLGCGTVLCLACGKSVISARSTSQRKIMFNWAKEGQRALFHCPNIQGVIIGMGISILNRPYRSSYLSNAESVIDPEARDKMTAEELTYLCDFLPSLCCANGVRDSDTIVHPAVVAHIRRHSNFLYELLQSTSIIAMSGLLELYQALFKWLQTVASHPKLASTLVAPIMLPVNWKTNEMLKTVEVSYRPLVSPKAMLEVYLIQAQAALKALKSLTTKNDPKTPQSWSQMTGSESAERDLPLQGDGEFERLTRTCQLLVKTMEAIDENLNANTRSMPTQSTEHITGRFETFLCPGFNDELDVGRYEAWAHDARFGYRDLLRSSSPAYQARYRAVYEYLEPDDVSRRILALAKEMSLLSTDLPTSWRSAIFLRIDDTRMDCMKAMITGPAGTPYENGCFIFDIILPVDDYIRPFKVEICSIGQSSFSPHLSASGEVYPDILRRWSTHYRGTDGSSILHSLLAVQGLVLEPEPFHAESDWEDNMETDNASKLHTNIRRTVVTGMATLLENPPYPFDKEIKTHFRLKANAIRRQLDIWEVFDEDLDAWSLASIKNLAKETPLMAGFKRGADRVRELLDGLEVSATQ